MKTITKDNVTYEVLGSTSVEGVTRTTVGLLTDRKSLSAVEMKTLLHELLTARHNNKWWLADLCLLVSNMPDGKEKSDLRAQLYAQFGKKMSSYTARYAMYKLAAELAPVWLRKAVTPCWVYTYLRKYKRHPKIKDIVNKAATTQELINVLREDMPNPDEGSDEPGDRLGWARTAFNTCTVHGKATAVTNAGDEAEVLYAEAITDWVKQKQVTSYSDYELLTIVPVLRVLCSNLKAIIK